MHATRFTLLILVAVGLASRAEAADVAWKSKEYLHVANREPLVQVLRGFAADQAVPLVVSEGVLQAFGDESKGLSGRFGPMPPQEFLDKITSGNGLDWYYDDNALFITLSSERETKLIPLGGIDERDLLETLEKLNVLTDRFPIKSLPKYGAVYASGPPRYLELINKTLELLASSSEAKASTELDVEVFPLQHAWADDTTFFFRNAEVVVPGVATVLSQLVGNGQLAPSLVGAQVIPRRRTVDGLRGQGLLAVGRQPQNVPYSPYPTAPVAPAAPAIQPVGNTVPQADPEAPPSPVILPDRRLNAIIVRDLKERLPSYGKLIQKLDVPVGLVEIEATIIDVDTDSGFEWGPPYEARWRRGGTERQANFSLNNTDVANFALTLLRGGQVEFLTRLKALETQGFARVVSRPSVLTINNVEAHLDNTQTFYVRVAGDFEVDLFDVTVGTSLRITPHIIEGPGGARRVKLIVHVEDGRATDETVDNIPRIAQNTIDTQAVLNENESLLVGGLIREEASQTESRIPFLGRIPKIGYLFKTVSTTRRKFERLVLITPRLIELPPQMPDNCQLPGQFESMELPGTLHEMAVPHSVMGGPDGTPNEFECEPGTVDPKQPLPDFPAPSLPPQERPKPKPRPMYEPDEPPKKSEPNFTPQPIKPEPKSKEDPERAMAFPKRQPEPVPVRYGQIDQASFESVSRNLRSSEGSAPRRGLQSQPPANPFRALDANRRHIPQPATPPPRFEFPAAKPLERTATPATELGTWQPLPTHSRPDDANSESGVIEFREKSRIENATPVRRATKHYGGWTPQPQSRVNASNRRVAPATTSDPRKSKFPWFGQKP